MLNLLFGTIELAYYIICTVGLVVYSYLVLSSNQTLKVTGLALGFFDSLYAAGALAAWRIVLFISCIAAMRANSRRHTNLETDEEHKDVSKLKRDLDYD